MKKKLSILLLLATSVFVIQCQNSSPKEETEQLSSTSIIKPVPLSSNGINNFNYPEDSVVIDGWINNRDDKKIAEHAWGIWTALNEQTNQKYDKQKLRVFETWLTIPDMQRLTLAEESEALTTENVKRTRGKLKNPNQFLHAKEALAKLGVEANYDSSRILGFVKYDPTAAKFAVSKKLFLESTLQGMLDRGMTDIPDFPSTGMTIKPVFEMITKEELDKNDGYYKLNVWSGPPNPAKMSPEGSWPGYIYIDPNNGGKGNGSVDNGSGRTPENTYNVTDFVHFKLDAQTVSELKEENLLADEGDIAVLVAMHVTSKEIKRWTWQSFWWTPDAANPPAPSSPDIAAQKPPQLKGAPAHYAMTHGYTFINPNQPFTGGNNIGTSIYAYNPYLEAGFGPKVLSDPAVVVSNTGQEVVNNYGVLSNCMSCHAHANYADSTNKHSPGYIGDTYIDMDGKVFDNTLKVDFAWSIQGNLISK